MPFRQTSWELRSAERECLALGPFLRSIAEVREGHIHGQLALQKGTCTADLSPEPPHDAHSLRIIFNFRACSPCQFADCSYSHLAAAWLGGQSQDACCHSHFGVCARQLGLSPSVLVGY